MVERQCSKDEILKKFQISSATLDNWIRTSIPDAFNNGKYDVTIIECFIKSHEKLNKRANKKSNATKTVSKTLLDYLNKKDWIPLYLEYIENKSLKDISAELIQTLLKRVKGETSVLFLDTIIPHNETYAFGIAYQIALTSGHQSKTGAYYTPRWIVEKVVKDLISKNAIILEPSCGVGFYLIEYIRAYKKKFGNYPENLVFGNDIDPIASKIAELSIQLETQNELKNFVITSKDGLEIDYVNKFDLVLTNPPYGVKNTYKEMRSTEIFSHFIHKCLTCYLKKDGILDFILPEAILNVGKHHEIRKFLLEDYSVVSVESFGKVFDGVFSDIIRLQVKKSHNKKNDVIFRDANQNEQRVSQQSLIDNAHLLVSMSKDNLDFIEECYSKPHLLLNDEIFAMGVVTGNNSQFVSDKKKDNWKPVITGKDIKDGASDYKNLKWISNETERFQQKPSMDLFKNKKICYQFINKNINSAVDETGTLLLNSANFIILKEDSPLKELGEEHISKVLNSPRMQKLYHLKFGGVLKVLKTHLQMLPIWIDLEET